ncbi:MAG: T9SS type A sorting domain-containing protein [Chitinophagaceae bacterium]
MKRLIPIVLIFLFSAISSKGQPSSVPAQQNAGAILRIYPNPAISYTNVDFLKAFEKGYTLQVYSFLGKKMYESANVTSRTTLNLSDYNRGVYVYQLRDKTGKMVESGKFQVSK